jgi:hypothetical protein
LLNSETASWVTPQFVQRRLANWTDDRAAFEKRLDFSSGKRCVGEDFLRVLADPWCLSPDRWPVAARAEFDW